MTLAKNGTPQVAPMRLRSIRCSTVRRRFCCQMRAAGSGDAAAVADAVARVAAGDVVGHQGALGREFRRLHQAFAVGLVVGVADAALGISCSAGGMMALGDVALTNAPRRSPSTSALRNASACMPQKS